MGKIVRLFDAASTDAVSVAASPGSTFMDNVAAKGLAVHISARGLEVGMGGVLSLELSLDGVNWAWPNTGYYIATPLPLSGMAEVSGANFSLMATFPAEIPLFYRYIRARLEGVSGGNNPAITVLVGMFNTESV